MKRILFVQILALFFILFCVRAEDITTIDGHAYNNVTGVKTQPDGIIVTINSPSYLGVEKIPFSKLPDDLKKKYNYDPFEEGLFIARKNQRLNLKKDLAFSLSDLDVAKKRAQTEHKLIGFIMVWDEFFVPAQPLGKGSTSGLAHFYTTFHNGMVLVFVRHENELDKVPDAVKKGFFGPDEGGFAPNMAVVSADCSQFICEIPYGGNESNGQIREEIFRKKIAEIKKAAPAQ